MSRRRAVDNSTSVSLFPFLAVLLCTMGALLVVLVAVSRSARHTALQQAATHQQVAATPEDPAARAELDKIDQYMARLKEVRAAAEKKLREDQLRLGQLENHMRRLQDELKTLTLAAAELDAMEEEHYDDRKQAEREIERLQRLIADSQTAIDGLKDQTKSRKRAYALVPYEGPNGTLRRPIYIECCKEGLILQPEGVCIAREDLQPPLGSGNALASALRAARDHHVQLHPEEGQNRNTEPYPMLLIRPEGADLFGLARRAIEAADFDFGFEPIETHWELNYGVADPQLANVEQQALEQARVRQQMLAAAAPRAYRNPELGASGRFEYDDESGEPLGESFGRGAGRGTPQAPFVPTTHGSGQSDEAAKSGLGVAHGNGDGGSGDGEPGTGSGDAKQQGIAADHQSAEGVADGPGQQPSGAENNRSASVSTNSSGATIPAASEEGAAGGASSDGQSMAASGGSPGNQQIVHQQQSDANKPANPNWAAPRKNARAVAVRRTIHVVVRDTQIGFISDEVRSKKSMFEGKTIQLHGDTVESLDQFVKAVQDHVDGWGIAGDGLYWRPVLEIQVGPDGQRRAKDLMRLLKDSDIDVHIPSTATNMPQGDSRATR